MIGTLYGYGTYIQLRRKLPHAWQHFIVGKLSVKNCLTDTFLYLLIHRLVGGRIKHYLYIIISLL